MQRARMTTQKKKTRAKASRRFGQGNLQVGHTRTSVPRLLFAAEQDVQIPVYLADLISATATQYGVAYKINTLADASVKYTGLSNFNAIYKRYRVLGYNLRISWQNRSATVPTAVSSLVTNSSTAPATSAIVFSNGVNPGGELTQLSINTAGHDQVYHHKKGSVAAFEGSVEVETSDSFAAATSAVADPASLLYLQLGLSAISGTSVTFSIGLLITGHLNVRYFDAIQQP